MNDTPEGFADTKVAAQDAPIGVQLWPTRTPEQADRFTLRSVATVRNEVRSWVVWTYEDNHIRTFEVGELVAVRVAEADLPKIQPPTVAVRFTPEQAATLREIAGGICKVSVHDYEIDFASTALEQLGAHGIV